jgi:hypothetical protein
MAIGVLGILVFLLLAALGPFAGVAMLLLYFMAGRAAR